VLAPAVALASLAWLALLIAAPFAPSSLAALIYAAGSVICHQIPERSFHLAGFQTAVGASVHVLGALSPDAMRWRVFTPQAARRVFIVSALPTLSTVGLEWTGVWAGTNIVRAIAGVTLGIGSALVVMSAVATLHYSACQRRQPIEPSQIPPHI
jgi:uncharacterized membrane protein